MKANAPEKIYVHEASAHELTEKLPYHIEYIRIDVFIEKAEKWLRNNWREYINVDADGIICFGHWESDFKNYMKGE